MLQQRPWFAFHPRRGIPTLLRQFSEWLCCKRRLQFLLWVRRHLFRGAGLTPLQLPLFCLELANPTPLFQLGDLPVGFAFEFIAVQRTAGYLASATAIRPNYQYI